MEVFRDELKRERARLKYVLDGSDCSTFLSAQGLIFVVDSNDRERVQESADELQKMVSARALGLSPRCGDRAMSWCAIRKCLSGLECVFLFVDTDTRTLSPCFEFGSGNKYGT